MKLVWLFYRANDYEADSLNTYAVISSLVNSAWALGSMLGPPVAGLISQHIGFPWAATITALAQSFMVRSEEHTSELQSRETISYAVFCLKKKKQTTY